MKRVRPHAAAPRTADASVVGAAPLPGRRAAPGLSGMRRAPAGEAASARVRA
ncbi:hypothetical protein [Sorangium sp. So ce1335]|uniref:hypothetical protein n=1 Tax=Sorangium sp. So ce1335 TaxID=3133335 RepID=UPI003F627441